MGIVEL